MLALLKIKNVALINELSIEFGRGFNVLTGETGSGKSIIVDSLGALLGERISNDLIKDGEEKAQIEGLFLIESKTEIRESFAQAGIELDTDDEIIVKREITANGKNRVFLNNQLVTLGFLKEIGGFLASIHGQGEQFSLYSPASHEILLDDFANLNGEREKLATEYRTYVSAKETLAALTNDEAEKLQLLDILRFQTDEIASIDPKPDEDDELETEKRRISNVEKLATLSGESYALAYENENAVASLLEQIKRKIEELSAYEPAFIEFEEGIEQARALIAELSYSLRDFGNSLEYSPERLNEIEERLAAIDGLKRKYGGSIETILLHFASSKEKLASFESADEREILLREKLEEAQLNYLKAARDISAKRKKAAPKFEKRVEKELTDVALDKARFEVRISSVQNNEAKFTPHGFDEVEFFFSANPGESPKPLARVASGGEASRLMLILKTVSGSTNNSEASVFDEVDSGIGGRVAEAVGRKLSELSKSQQVLCVTHQPQVAAFADRHFVVEKEIAKGKTNVSVKYLNESERIDEIARMLAGENITATARDHARELIGGNPSRHAKKL